jgi:hypothetical protein
MAMTDVRRMGPQPIDECLIDGHDSFLENVRFTHERQCRVEIEVLRAENAGHIEVS